MHAFGGCSPVARVVSVVKVALKNKFRRKKTAGAGGSGYSGPVNLPEGLAAAMRKTHSYVWLDNAVKQDTPDDGGELPCNLKRTDDGGESHWNEKMFDDVEELLFPFHKVTS